MSLAVDFLRSYLDQEKITQSDYADACGMTAANLSEVLSGSVTVSARNLSKLLRGIPDRTARVRFAVAHLQDQIPQELEEEITVAAGRLETGIVRESGDGEAERSALVTTSFTQLPAIIQQRVITLIHALRRDEELRQAFTAMMNYAVSTNDSAAPQPGNTLDAIMQEDAQRRASRRRPHKNAASSSSKSSSA